MCQALWFWEVFMNINQYWTDETIETGAKSRAKIDLLLGADSFKGGKKMGHKPAMTSIGSAYQDQSSVPYCLLIVYMLVYLGLVETGWGNNVLTLKH